MFSKDSLYFFLHLMQNAVEEQICKNVIVLKNVGTLNEQSYSFISPAYEMPISCIIYPTADSFSFSHTG